MGPPGRWGKKLPPDGLPALPMLVHRLLGEPGGLQYVCGKFDEAAREHGRGVPLSVSEFTRSKYAKNALGAVIKAKIDGYSALVILIDRNRRDPKDTLVPLGSGRDNGVAFNGLPCAIGVAVETFDAWMIVDGKAIGKAGGDASKSHPGAENLDKEEGSGRHPKDRAAQLFGAGDSLGPKYAIIAACVDLKTLAQCCPKGFAPFADDVRARILPAVTPSS